MIVPLRTNADIHNKHIHNLHYICWKAFKQSTLFVVQINSAGDWFYILSKDRLGLQWWIVNIKPIPCLVTKLKTNCRYFYCYKRTTNTWELKFGLHNTLLLLVDTLSKRMIMDACGSHDCQIEARQFDLLF